jgi:hypothetical protein
MLQNVFVRPVILSRSDDSLCRVSAGWREFHRTDDSAGRLFHTLQIEEETTRHGFRSLQH